jgi:nitrile hydratase accessory protein
VKPDKTSHIDKLSGLASDGEGPVFAQPWEAQLFAMVLELARQGVFSWAEWTKMLGVEIAAVRDRGEADSGVTYYRHWLATLEQLLSEKGVVQDSEVHRRMTQWREAYRNTPHGEPIHLAAGDSSQT